jgi:hypothetical protein
VRTEVEKHVAIFTNILIKLILTDSLTKLNADLVEIHPNPIPVPRGSEKLKPVVKDKNKHHPLLGSAVT